VLEGRAIGLVKKRGRLKGLGMIVLVSGTLAVLCGLAGWLLTPIIFGSEFIPSGQAFPLLALAGALAFLFVCISAINAQDRKASFWPGLAILVTLVISCVLLALYFTSDVVIISLGLTLAQAVGVAVVLVQYSSKRGKHR
jgi:hypothetical protein